MPWLSIERMRKLVVGYRKGILTLSEAASTIADCALVDAFFEHIDEVPEELLSEIRENSERVCGHPEDVLIISGTLRRGTPEEIAAAERREREVTYWSRRKLQQHFHPDKRPDPFEPVRSIGTVEEAIEYDGDIVVLGDLSTYLLYSYPVQLRPPESPTIITRRTASVLVLRDVERNSGEPSWQRYGRPGLVFGSEVRSPRDVPPGTEVLVDRSELDPLPGDPPLELLD